MVFIRKRYLGGRLQFKNLLKDVFSFSLFSASPHTLAESEFQACSLSGQYMICISVWLKQSILIYLKNRVIA